MILTSPSAILGEALFIIWTKWAISSDDREPVTLSSAAGGEPASLVE
jgi:hypothetical protein